MSEWPRAENAGTWKGFRLVDRRSLRSCADGIMWRLRGGLREARKKGQRFEGGVSFMTAGIALKIPSANNSIGTNPRLT